MKSWVWFFRCRQKRKQCHLPAKGEGGRKTTKISPSSFPIIFPPYPFHTLWGGHVKGERIFTKKIGGMTGRFRGLFCNGWLFATCRLHFTGRMARAGFTGFSLRISWTGRVRPWPCRTLGGEVVPKAAGKQGRRKITPADSLPPRGTTLQRAGLQCFLCVIGGVILANCMSGFHQPTLFPWMLAQPSSNDIMQNSCYMGRTAADFQLPQPPLPSSWLEKL